MEVKQYVSLEVVKGDFTFKLILPVNSNWQDAKDATYEMLQEVIKQAEYAKNAQAALQNSETEKKE